MVVTLCSMESISYNFPPFLKYYTLNSNINASDYWEAISYNFLNIPGLTNFYLNYLNLNLVLIILNYAGIISYRLQDTIYGRHYLLSYYQIRLI